MFLKPEQLIPHLQQLLNKNKESYIDCCNVIIKSEAHECKVEHDELIRILESSDQSNIDIKLSKRGPIPCDNRIAVTLYIFDSPKTIKEICEETGIDKKEVTYHINNMSNIKKKNYLVDKEKKMGDKKTKYILNKCGKEWIQPYLK